MRGLLSTSGRWCWSRGSCRDSVKVMAPFSESMWWKNWHLWIGLSLCTEQELNRFHIPGPWSHFLQSLGYNIWNNVFQFFFLGRKYWIWPCQSNVFNILDNSCNKSGWNLDWYIFQIWRSHVYSLAFLPVQFIGLSQGHTQRQTPFTHIFTCLVNSGWTITIVLHAFCMW